MKKNLITVLAVLATLFSGCHKDKVDPQDVNPPLSTEQKVNQFVESQMKDIYLWADLVRDRNVSNELSPAQFLEEMVVNRETDPWTVLLKDGVVTRSLSDGKEISFGYELLFWKFTDEKIFAQVAYVYPDSPAAKAGLKRGDIITKYQGQELNLSNYQDLIYNSNIEVQLGEFKDPSTLFTFDKKYQLAARTIEINPILVDSVLNIEGKKIGYMVYTEFIDNSISSLNDLNTAILKFKQADIDEFILDLRYNPGGTNTSARRLCSLLAPAENVKREDLISTKTWNKTYQEKYKSIQALQEEHFESAVIADNLDLKRIYILISDRTASASEFLISGLTPYLSEVITIGTTTVGKYVGSVARTPDSKESDIQNWELYPIVFYYKNARGESVKDKITPTYEAKEYADYLPPFGDREDPLLQKAISLITGQPVITSLTSKSNNPVFTSLKAPAQKQKEILIQK